MRKVISESGNAIQYEIYPGPRVNKAVVIMRSENNSLKTYTYDFADGGSVIVVRDIVHLPVDSTPSVTDSN
jgi:c-di-GMP-binding flagellar brake protein YcgR